MYFDIFSSLCDNDMQKKLNNIRGIKKMSEKEIWEQVEKMFLASNPMYMRNIQALETRIIKGESVSKIMNSRPVRQSLSDNQWEYAVRQSLSDNQWIGQVRRDSSDQVPQSSSDNQWEYAVPTKLVGQPMDRPGPTRLVEPGPTSFVGPLAWLAWASDLRILLARKKKWRILFSN